MTTKNLSDPGFSIGENVFVLKDYNNGAFSTDFSTVTGLSINRENKWTIETTFCTKRPTDENIYIFKTKEELIAVAKDLLNKRINDTLEYIIDDLNIIEE